MVFVNELFKITFKRDWHVSKGAPKDFYPSEECQCIRYLNAEMDAFASSNPGNWMRDLSFIEMTVKKPDECRLEKPESVEEERLWTERVSLKRTFERNGKKYSCECKLFKVDGRFFVPLVGRYAPSIKEAA